MAAFSHPLSSPSKDVLQPRIGASSFAVSSFASLQDVENKPASSRIWRPCALVDLMALGLLRRHSRCRRSPSKRWPKRTAVVRRGAEYGQEFVGEEVDQDLAESLQQRTLEALDLDFVLERLQALCYTATAAEMAIDPEVLLAQTPEEARALYALVVELTQLEDADLDLDAKLDIRTEVDQCRHGRVLEPPQLQKVSDSIEALLRLRNGLDGASARGVNIPLLMGHCQDIELPDRLLDIMLEAFQEDGELSLKKFPELGQLRERIRELEETCSKVMGEVLSSGKYSTYLSDDGYMQFGGRYVLGVKSRSKGKVGRLFDESRSGRVAYVEPYEVVQYADDLEQSKKALERMARRILGNMSLAISHAADALERCLKAAAHIDLARARLFLGEDMEGEVPTVGDDGIIAVRHARNPCLVLRGGKKVVGYRLELGKSSQCLLLTGPNAGGKTVVLKTLGLLALLARCGIPIPGGEAPRVDFFEVVLADVGDMQTIVDDLSTYSAHLVASRLMLSIAQGVGPRALVMVDEAGTGTDPQQGAALARAMLEGFLDMGARVVTTTHSNQLKDWAVEDERTMTAAMEYKMGRPTYRLTTNAVGESHAIETAQRLGLPPSIVKRAEELLGDDQRRLLALQRQASAAEQDFIAAKLEADQREAAAQQAILETQSKESDLAHRAQQLTQMEVEVKERMNALKRQTDAELKARVEVKERQFQDVVRRLKMEAQHSGVQLRIVGDALEDLRVQVTAPKASSSDVPAIPGAMGLRDPLNRGDWVVVMADPPWYGLKGQVERIELAKDGGAPCIHVRLGANGKLKEFSKTQLKRTQAPPQAARTLKKPKNEVAAPTRNYSNSSVGWIHVFSTKTTWSAAGG
ncbi:unnamed protein product [Durusdinium trenchii]|uniref:Uncharacterized protein n=1 Tax=Durusdinium trenchii TaxID=1381693 RepID=A0ABP0PQ33_9DINO